MKRTAQIVTFSGIDGAGKSTQIQELQLHLDHLGYRSVLYTFWDDVVVLSRFREFVSHKAFKGDVGVGSPEKPIYRRDKNVISWYTILARLFLYLLDSLSLHWRVWNAPRGADFVVFDRYIYDELANLPLRNWAMRSYVKLLLTTAPTPAVAYLVDADPDAAYRRKPEYPREFLHQNRQAYLSLSQLIPAMQVVGPGSPEELAASIQQSVSRHGLPGDRACRQPKPQFSSIDRKVNNSVP